MREEGRAPENISIHLIKAFCKAWLDLITQKVIVIIYVCTENTNKPGKTDTFTF